MVTLARQRLGLACWLSAISVLAGCANGSAGSTVTLSVPRLGRDGPVVTVSMGAPERASASGVPATLLVRCHADPQTSVAVRIDAVATATSARRLPVSFALVPAQPPGRVVVPALLADPCDYHGGAGIGAEASVWQGHPLSYHSWVIFVDAIGPGSGPPPAASQALGNWVLGVGLGVGQADWKPPLLRVTGARALICPDGAGIRQAYLVPAGQLWKRPPWAATGSCQPAGG